MDCGRFYTDKNTSPFYVCSRRKEVTLVLSCTVDIIMISDDCLSVLDRSSRVHIVVYLGNVDKGVDVGFVPLHVLVLDQPLDLLLDEFFTWQEHILQDIHQFSL